MNLDVNGLPMQADGDRNDQLQRVGMIHAGECLGGPYIEPRVHTSEALAFLLQPEPGVFVRYVGGSPDNVSADQLIGALAALVVNDSGTARRIVWLMFKQMCKRFGFAQNTKDGLNGSTKWKVPDFMLLRALPLFARAAWWLYPLAYIADLYLVILAVGAVLDRNPDHVDDGNTILTLAVCRVRFPTLFSLVAIRLYSKLRPWNYGCFAPGIGDNAYKPVYGALRWYHRAEAGGNEEVAELWKPIVDKYFGGAQ